MKVEGDKAEVPPSAMTTELKESAAASASPGTDSEGEEATTLPLVWKGSEWKLNGQKYFELLAKNS